MIMRAVSKWSTGLIAYALVGTGGTASATITVRGSRRRTGGQHSDIAGLGSMATRSVDSDRRRRFVPPAQERLSN